MHEIITIKHDISIVNCEYRTLWSPFGIYDPRCQVITWIALKSGARNLDHKVDMIDVYIIECAPEVVFYE